MMPYHDMIPPQDVFVLLLWALGRLGQPSAPTFPLAVAILQQTESVKLYLLMLDLGHPELVTQLFTTLLGCARWVGHAASAVGGS